MAIKYQSEAVELSGKGKCINNKSASSLDPSSLERAIHIDMHRKKGRCSNRIQFDSNFLHLHRFIGSLNRVY